MNCKKEKLFDIDESKNQDLNLKNFNNISLNYPQLKCLIFLSMLYISIMICNAILTNKWISLGDYFVFGGAFVSPFLFILGDIIAEVYGFKIARYIVLIGFICQTIFAIIVTIMLLTPQPSNWHEQHSFMVVLGSILRIDVSGFIAYFSSSLVNVYVVTKWKMLLQGRMFWLRSLGASTISEGLYSAIAILMIGFGSLSFFALLNVILLSYLIKIIYSIFCAYPGALIANYIKKKFNIDVYDFNKKLYLFGN